MLWGAHVNGNLFIASEDDGGEDHEANSLEQGGERFREWKGNNQGKNECS